MNKAHLTDIARWSHLVLDDILEPGDLAVDLTVGNGKDTLFLREQVGPDGYVMGFDIQEQALDKAASLLADAGARVNIYLEEDSRPRLPEPGVHLLCTDHAHWTDHLSEVPKAVIANLGYLPGGDRAIVTRPESTLKAIGSALDILPPGGRVAVVCYVGHDGGREEADALEELFGGLSRKEFRVLRAANYLTENSPFLLAVEKL
jgi:predicted methyltransferase